MIKKVRVPSQSKVRTSAQASRPSGLSGLDRKRKALPESPKKEELPVDDIINIDTIILE